MKLKKNEQGYALVLVLLLIVFIAIISATFMKLSINNAKQEHIVDKNNLSYVLAEMGVKLYSTTYLNAYYVEKDNILKRFKDEFNKEKNSINDNKSITDKQAAIKYRHNELRKNVAIELREYLKGISLPTASVPQYSIINSQLDIDSYGYETFIHGDVLGDYKEGRPATLTVDLLFEVPSLLENNSGGIPSGDLDWITKTPVQLIRKPDMKCLERINTEPCLADKFDHVTSGKNSIIYFDQNAVKDNNGNEGKNFKGLKIYLDSNLTLPNMGGTRNLEVFSTGEVKLKDADRIYNSSITVDNNIESIGNGNKVFLDNTKMHANKNIVINRLEMANNSQLFTGNELVVKGDFKASNSRIFVSSNFKNDDSNGNDFTLVNNSKMCVGENVEVNEKTNKFLIDSTSNLYILKSNSWLEGQKNVVKVNSLRELKAACSGAGSGDIPNDVQWKKPKVDVTY